MDEHAVKVTYEVRNLSERKEIIDFSEYENVTVRFEECGV